MEIALLFRESGDGGEFIKRRKFCQIITHWLYVLLVIYFMESGKPKNVLSAPLPRIKRKNDEQMRSFFCPRGGFCH